MEQTYTFEQALARLEQIVQSLNTGKAPLAEALAFYEEGAKLMQFCHTQLDEAEQKVMKVTPNRETREPDYFPLEDE